MTRLADKWSEVLPKSHREALFDALCILTDDFLGAGRPQDTLVASFLPEKYLPRYGDLFLKKFFVTLTTVGYRLAEPDPPMPLLSCTAEELALHVFIEEAKFILEERGIEAWYGGFEDEVYQDLDFELLYQLRFDGIEDSPIGTELGMGNLHFDEWFFPFDNAAAPIHPYAQPDA